ncbi:iron complex transport system permease protein [Clostridium tetanomorphum]|uniref:Iron ABC transporter permease n=1 Tax=Clostridium tetanomorphum TaxID=1553 RepID=A0A923E7U8_CLOTT|nr:iron ABC transporter permease [Clostridium tetanomorphum]KAJ52721.1 ferrichrome transport system permease FhuB [Clostridium tetanomorphum DSM 665]MBC2396726.1 iron ABC transporter permease [Clostridium tetanomorphum]MBP1863314.1 iron complex transport system permease protein [Clostridium tetanomorphum]NRS84422.1 iron complex transport system permease protein [Clostridium tetanomorphum]NRZ97637.1 iron complex transport system permease protein [Clostridium tetanomorphum]
MSIKRKLSLESSRSKIVVLVILITLLIVSFIASLLLGYIKTSYVDLINTFINYNNSLEHIVLKTSRISRATIALFIGASLSLSGVLMQTLTKNPMASPGLLGVNSGAAFFMVFTYSFFPSVSQNYIILFSFIGAAMAVVLVYTLAGGIRGSINTFDLILAGAAISAFFISLTQVVLYKDQKTMEEVMFWLTGSVEGRSIESLKIVIPYMVVCWIICYLISGKLNIFFLGEEIAKGLGLNIELIKLQILILVVIMAGASVAVAGPISLVGIIIPHVTRALVGSEFKWVVPFSAVLGSIFLLLADIGSRFIVYPKDIPVGAVTAIMGAPFFVYLARKVENK